MSFALAVAVSLSPWSSGWIGVYFIIHLHDYYSTCRSKSSCCGLSSCLANTVIYSKSRVDCRYYFVAAEFWLLVWVALSAQLLVLLKVIRQRDIIIRFLTSRGGAIETGFVDVRVAIIDVAWLVAELLVAH